MSNLKPEQLVSKTDKLLYEILQELKKLSKLKPQPARPLRKAVKGKAKPKGAVTCKKCGEQFDNRGVFLRHMKAHKKEE